MRFDQGRFGAALLMVGLALAACGERDRPATPAAEGPGAAPQQPLFQRQEVVRGTLTIEGTPQDVILQLYRTPREFPLGFSTYHVSDFQTEEVASGEVAGVRFVAAFGGQRSENAVLSVAVLPAGSTRQEAEEVVQVISEQLGTLRPLDTIGPDGLTEYAFSSRAGTVGRVLLGERRNLFFYILIHYPVEMGDGFEPRADVILDQWRWEDGAPLIRP